MASLEAGAHPLLMDASKFFRVLVIGGAGLTGGGLLTSTGCSSDDGDHAGEGASGDLEADPITVDTKSRERVTLQITRSHP